VAGGGARREGGGGSGPPPPEIFKLELNYVKLTAVNDSCCFKSHTVNVSQLKFGVES